MPTGSSRPGIGIAWFTEEDYASVRGQMADAEDMHDTFAEWHASAKQAVDTAEAEGLVVRRVYIDAEKFLAWCSQRGLRADGKARSKYAAERAAEQERIWGRPLT